MVYPRTHLGKVGRNVTWCFRFAWQYFNGGGGYRDGFCEKILKASPMSNRANVSRLQDGPTVGQGSAISDGGSAYVTTYLRRGKSCTAATGAKERS